MLMVMLLTSLLPDSFDNLPQALDTLGLPAGILLGVICGARVSRPR